MDALVELPFAQWPHLKEKIKEVWPHNVAAFYAIHFNEKYPKIRETFRFKIYCPYGNLDNGFVALSSRGNFRECVIFPLGSKTTDSKVLKTALIDSMLIEWSQKVCINMITSDTLQLLNEIKPQMNFKLYDVGSARTYFLDCHSKIFQDLRCPTNTYLAAIKEEDIHKVNDVWPYKHDDSSFYFSIFASNGLSYGLYSLQDELVAWIFINEYNILCHLYCEQKYRRMGYAEYLIKYVVNDQLSQGNDVFTYVEEYNVASCKLFEKVGFLCIDNSAYIFVQK